MNLPLVRQRLPVAAPARVLACGAWLKNTACLLDGDSVWMSPLHGDLGTPQARALLLDSVARLRRQAGGPIEAVAHDLHPDFFSTELAQQLAYTLGVPAIAVQHHHAHIAQVQAQHAPGQPLLGWALDGVGLGTDGSAWGGELLLVQDANCQRLNHLPPLLLPGGDVAAREPWRMAAAALHRLGLLTAQTPGENDSASLRNSTQAPATASSAVVSGPLRGTTLAADATLGLAASPHLRVGTPGIIPPASLKGLRRMLARGLNCPSTTSAGRWFDAVAGLLGVCWWQTEEAQAAIALERLAAQWLGENPAPALNAELLEAGLDLDVLMRRLLARMAALPGHANASATATATAPEAESSLCIACSDTADQAALPAGASDAARADALVLAAQSEAAALFHVALADALARAAITAAAEQQITRIALSGGCFFNRILRTRMVDTLTQAGLAVHLPADSAYGDAGLALGQAWVAAHTLHATNSTTPAKEQPTRNSLCA